MRQPTVDVQRVARRRAASDLLQAVAQTGVFVHDAGCALCEAYEPVGCVVLIGGRPITEHVPVVVPGHGLAVNGGQAVGRIICIGGGLVCGGYAQAVADSVVGVVVEVTIAVIGARQAGEAIIGVVDDHAGCGGQGGYSGAMTAPFE